MAAALLMVGTSSCDGLDQYPHTSTTSNDVYTSAEGYQSVLSGIYAAMIQRVSSVSDEERSQNYIRTLVQFQDCSTDAGDAIWLAGESLTDVNNISWTASDAWCSAMWYHIYNIIAMSNELIRNASDGNISGYSDSDKEAIILYRNEARFLRAYCYWQAMDFYSSMSFVTDADAVGSYVPTIATRAEVFDYVVSELTEIADELPVTNYGHANRGAAYALLARVYLNGYVYTGTEYYTECIAACKEVLEDGYVLESDYAKLFNGENHKRAMGGSEIIFALACDAANTTTWDCTTFLTCGSVLSNFEDYADVTGTLNSGSWNNYRARPQLYNVFEEGDTRNRLVGYDRYAYSTWESSLESDGYYTVDGDTDYYYYDRSLDIIGHDETTSGYRMNKWTNLTDDGESASDCGVSGANTDFPMFRLADVYLMLAEAQVRGGSGSSATEALGYVNLVRERAFGSTAGDVTAGDLTLDFLCEERLRELYLECIRRTDLIRFGKYVSGYNWQWKGGVQDGTDVDTKYQFLAIPEAEYSVNPQLQVINNSLGY